MGQLTVSGLKVTDSLPRPFLHAVAPRNTTAARGGLLDIAIDATVHGWVNATKQCTPVGIDSKAEWGVSVRVDCSPHRGMSAAKSDDDEALVSAALRAIGETPTHAGVVNAIEDFGAAADGRADDAPALQAAIYAAQFGRKALFLPAGLYLVNSTLRVFDTSATHTYSNCSGPSQALCPAPLHMIGEGGWGYITSIQAGQPMEAVIDVAYGGAVPSAPAAAPSSGLFANFAIIAGGKAQWGFRALAIARSRLVGLNVNGALSVGIEMG